MRLIASYGPAQQRSVPACGEPAGDRLPNLGRPAGTGEKHDARPWVIAGWWRNRTDFRFVLARPRSRGIAIVSPVGAFAEVLRSRPRENERERQSADKPRDPVAVGVAAVVGSWLARSS